MLRSFLSCASLFILLLFNFSVNGQSLDPSFGVNGVATVQFNLYGTAGDMNLLVLPDKKILVTNYSAVPNQTLGTRTYLIISRLNENGTLDNSFGQNGYFTKDLGPYNSVIAEIQGRRIALQPDGKIVATCAIYNQNRLFNDILVLRLNANGTPDNTFGTNGFEQFYIGDYGDGGTCILVQSDGKIVIGAGTYVGSVRHYAVIRMNSNGITDNTFATAGVLKFQVGYSYVNEWPTAILQQPDGKILIGGNAWFGNYDMAITRLKTNGDLDNTFGGGDGITTIPFGVNDENVYDIALQPDNKIILAGSASYPPNTFVALARVDASGSLDNTFDNDGKATYNFGNPNGQAAAVKLQSDGKILIAGNTYSQATDFDWGMMRFNSQGSLDSTFNGNGKKVYTITSDYDVANDLAIQSDGKVLMGGLSGGGGTISIIRTNALDPMQPNCGNVSFTGSEENISVSGLRTAPIAAVQVFNSSWTSVFSQAYSDGTDHIDINSLPGGQYYVKVTFYTSNWSSICVKEGFVTVTKPPTTPTVSITSAETVTEKNGTVTAVTVSLSEPTDKPVSIDFTTVDGTAKAGSDYVAKSGTFTIPAGTSGIFIFVDLIDDNVTEPSETFQINISNPVNAFLGTSSGTVTILDNDQPGPDCNGIKVTPNPGAIGIGGLSAPNVVVQIFNSNWATVFNNGYAHPDSVNVTIAPGSYVVKTTFYSAAWSWICEKAFSITVPGGQPPCPPGATCVSNICPNTIVNLDTVFSVANLLPGATVTWHTGTPATDNNKLTPTQAQNVSQSGTYYAAINISGCYSSTKMFVVTINQCNSTLSMPVTFKMEDMQTESGVRVVPNPFKQEVRIEIQSKKQEGMTISVMNMNGQVLRTEKVQLKVGANQVWLRSLEGLPAGPYLIKMISGSGIKTQKLLRQE